MSDNQGWIRLHRKIQDNPIWLSEVFTRAQAWVDLMLLANHKYGYFFIRGNKIDVERGEVALSEQQLALRWKWSRGKVRGFLKTLKKEQQIEQQKSRLINKIIILNYDFYQETEQQIEQQKDNRKTTERQQKDTNNNNKNNKNNKNKYNIPEPLWADFVKIRNKRKAPITDTAMNGIIKEAGIAGFTLEEALQECCTRGWQSFKAEWVVNQEKQNGTYRKQPTVHDNFTAGIALALDELNKQQGY